MSISERRANRGAQASSQTPRAAAAGGGVVMNTARAVSQWGDAKGGAVLFRLLGAGIAVIGGTACAQIVSNVNGIDGATADNIIFGSYMVGMGLVAATAGVVATLAASEVTEAVCKGLGEFKEARKLREEAAAMARGGDTPSHTNPKM